MNDFNFTSEQETLLDQISKWFHDYESGDRKSVGRERVF